MEEIVDYHERTGHRAWKTCDEMWPEFSPRIPNIARENHVWALFINQAGQPHPCIKFVGPTFAVDPGGTIVAQTDDGNERLITIETPEAI